MRRQEQPKKCTLDCTYLGKPTPAGTFCSCALFFVFALHPYCSENNNSNSQWGSKEYISPSYDTTVSSFSYWFQAGRCLAGNMEAGEGGELGSVWGLRVRGCADKTDSLAGKEGIFPLLLNSLKRPKLFFCYPQEKREHQIISSVIWNDDACGWTHFLIFFLG